MLYLHVYYITYIYSRFILRVIMMTQLGPDRSSDGLPLIKQPRGCPAGRPGAAENVVHVKCFQMASEIHFLISHFWGFRKGCGSHVDIANHCISYFMQCAPCFSEKACSLWISHLKCRNSLLTKGTYLKGMHPSILRYFNDRVEWTHEFPRRQHGSLPSKLPKCHGSRDVSRISLRLVFQ